MDLRIVWTSFVSSFQRSQFIIKMKVLALVILVIGSTKGLGSGPYLPSGWKPAGPAFYLPTEIQKPVAVPLKDVPVQESETSGSSFLREYGPPGVQVEDTEVSKVQEEVSQDITQQALPDPVTEQAFVEIEAKSVSEDEEKAEINQEVVTEQIASVVEKKYDSVASVVETATATESQNIEEQTIESEAIVETEVESQTESSLAAGETVTEKLAEVNEAEKVVEAVEKAVEEKVEKFIEESAAIQEAAQVQVTEKLAEVNEAEKVVEAVEKAVEEKVEKFIEESAAIQEAAQVQISQQDSENANSNIVAAIEQKTMEVAEVKAAEEEVKNIEEALVNLENEIKAQITEEVSEIKTIQGSVQTAQEGFLEYGPPGFTEYGPPKGVPRVAEKKLVSTNEINETRRRRFSPKFRTPKRKI